MDFLTKKTLSTRKKEEGVADTRRYAPDLTRHSGTRKQPENGERSVDIPTSKRAPAPYGKKKEWDSLHTP